MSADIHKAWSKAQAAWEATGCVLPCYDEAYMAARAELWEVYTAAKPKKKPKPRPKLRPMPTGY